MVTGATVLSPALSGLPAPTTDPAAVRTTAAQERGAAERYAGARRRLQAAGAELVTRWSGAAGGSAVADLAARCESLEVLRRAHEDAADALAVCARALEDAHEARRQAEQLERRDALERSTGATNLLMGAFSSPFDSDRCALREQARRLAQEALDTERAAVARAAEELHGLAARLSPDDRRALSAGDQLAGVGRGAVDAVRGSLASLAGLSLPRMLADPDGWRQQVRAVRDGAASAARNPRDAAELALGLDQLRAGEYGEWVGGFLPDLVAGVATGGGLPAARRGADLAGDLGKLGDDVADVGRRVDAGGPVEVRDGVDLPQGYVAVVEDLTPARRTHILDGDATGGGHRAGTGRPGKTEFPASWSDDDIIRAVMETARRPQTVVDQAPHRESFLVSAEHGGVTVQVAVNRAGEVLTGYPAPGGPGVVSNPRRR